MIFEETRKRLTLAVVCAVTYAMSRNTPQWFPLLNYRERRWQNCFIEWIIGSIDMYNHNSILLRLSVATLGT
jgi:hypothetical protein